MKIHRSRSVRRVKVTGDGKRLVSHAGVALLCELADRSGLTKAMSVAMDGCGIEWHTHDPGVVLTHLAASIADGARCLVEIEALRSQDDLFGPVASTATAWRAVQAVGATQLRAIPVAVGQARKSVWAAAPPGPSLVFDFDATLVTAHSEKQDAAPNYKHGFGFHPLGVWCDTTGEPFAAMLRPGNAGSNDADDHIELLARTFEGLPEPYRAGHDIGDTPDMVDYPILIRADSAGATHGFVDALGAVNCDYSIGFPVDARVRDALLWAQEEDWQPAVDTNGETRPGAEVTELTGLVDLAGWGVGTRLICRRERPHPGAQLSLFDTNNGWRHTCFITNTADDDPVGCDIAALELRHRGHARVEDRVRGWKDCGLANLPFEDYVRNETWVATSLVAGVLMAWSQLICFDADLTRAEPHTIRHRILHVGATLARKNHGLILRLDQNWPWTPQLTAAFGRLRTAIP